MTNWQLEALNDQITTAAWNRLNAPDPAEQALKAAAVSIGEASSFLDICTDRLMEAAEDLKGTPMQDKVLSFVDQLEEIDGFMRAMKKAYERGERK